MFESEQFSTMDFNTNKLCERVQLTYVHTCYILNAIHLCTHIKFI